MIIYKIRNLWNYVSFPNCKFLKICYFSKFNNFRNLMISESVKFEKFWEFSKLVIFVIFQNGIFLNFQIWKINKFL